MTKRPPDRLTDLLRSTRKRHGGISQEQLSELIGVSSSMIAHVETGRRAFGDSTLMALISTLGVDQSVADALLIANGERRQAIADRTSAPPAPGPTWAEMPDIESRLAALERRVADLEATTPPTSLDERRARRQAVDQRTAADNDTSDVGERPQDVRDTGRAEGYDPDEDPPA